MLAIDVGMLMTARNPGPELRRRALAGAVALGFDDYADRSPGGPAVLNAMEATTKKQVLEHVSVEPVRRGAST